MSRQLAVLWGGVAAILVALSPWASAIADGLWHCAFKSLTGIPCPTCGTGRAALALARLDFGTALMHYPLPAIGWIAFVTCGLAALAMTLTGRTPPAVPSRLSTGARAALVLAVLSNWAYSIATGV